MGTNTDNCVALGTGIRVCVTAVASDVAVCGWAIEVCEKGILLSADTTLPLGTEVNITATLREESRLHRLQTRGRVTRIEDGSMGVRLDPGDTAALPVLKRIAHWHSRNE